MSDPMTYYQGLPPELPTLRDRFAIAALQAIISRNDDGNWVRGGKTLTTFPETRDFIAETSYEYADAMLAERERAK